VASITCLFSHKYRVEQNSREYCEKCYRPYGWENYPSM